MPSMSLLYISYCLIRSDCINELFQKWVIFTFIIFTRLPISLLNSMLIGKWTVGYIETSLFSGNGKSVQISELFD